MTTLEHLAMSTGLIVFAVIVDLLIIAGVFLACDVVERLKSKPKDKDQTP